MKIGVGLPASIPWVKNTDIIEWARGADRGPFSSLGLIDRLVYPGYDPLITLAAAAAVTQRVRLVTTILLAALHRPAILAKQAASLDALSGGRLTLGMGVGSREDDFRAAGVPFKSRARRFEEEIGVMKRIWNGEPLGEGVGPIGPAPARKGGPEILIGGYALAAIQRGGRLADGFITGGVASPDGARQSFRIFEAAWQEAGRAGKPRLVCCIYTGVGEDAARRGRKYLDDYYGPAFGERVAQGLCTTPQSVVDAVHGFADAGADELILWTTVPEVSHLERLEEIVGKI